MLLFISRVLVSKGVPLKATRTGALRVIGVTIISALALAGCSSSEPAAVVSEVDSEVTTKGEVLTVWLDEFEALGLESVALQFEADTGTRVDLVIKTDIVNEFLGASDNAPDIVLGPHGLQRGFLAGGLIAPFSLEGAETGFNSGAVQAFSQGGQQYGLPYAQESIALVCTESAMPKAPETFQDVVDVGLAISLNDGTGDPYHLYPLQTSFGSSVFEVDPTNSGILNLALGNEEGLAFANWLSKNASLFDLESNTALIQQQLIDGEKGCWITGPWSGLWFSEVFGEEGWNAYEVPSAGGQVARPFLEVRGAMLSARAGDPSAATKFIVEYLGSDPGQIAMFQATGRTPSNLKALESAKDFKIPYQFGLSGSSAVPRPVSSKIDSVWFPLGEAQMAILRKDDDPNLLWRKMSDEIAEAIRD
ncbi:MAG: arabinogalactan oligomer/maltooligosaccharide transport system substrate-binding protein [Aquiluna sp.]|jgi:arabinogalactan oligomer/maltooligosaccharide transport system substrate-binding protein